MFASNNSQVSDNALYIESVFSNYLYFGTGSSQTITNNIDTTNYGGLVWIKGRSGATGHRLTDTARGVTKALECNSTAAEATESTGLTSFGTTGFTIGADANYNTNAATYVSWTFREQAKFFDIVTYTGNSASRTISHNLGSVPGCIIIKRTDTTSAWAVYHQSLANTEYMVLNTTAAKATGAGYWDGTTPTSTVFSLGTASDVNASGGTYVAYLFAHNAGGFGTSGTDNVITCGSFTADGSGNATVNLGYEPQWILLKSYSGADDWYTYDDMRGWQNNSANGSGVYLRPNSSSTETSTSGAGYPTSTGFRASGFSGTTTNVLYIAIRRGPMRTPTSGLNVFSPVLSANTTPSFVTGFPVDSGWAAAKLTADKWYQTDRLRGNPMLNSASTAAEAGSGNGFDFDYQNGFWDNLGLGTAYIGYGFRRAPGFFDTVCYSGNSAQTAYNHNLGVTPELVIVKVRNLAGESWPVWCVYGTQQNSYAAILNGTSAYANRGQNLWGTTPSGAPSMTSTTFRLGDNIAVNETGYTYIAYLFASCNGVSKVGTYSGTGATQTISCGFAARFVVIKRIDDSVSSTASWFVWDTTRGMVSGTDPHLQLNSTANENNITNFVYTSADGFQIATTSATINASGGSYIFLAVG